MITTNRETESGHSQGEIILQPGLLENTARAPAPRNNATTKWKTTVYLRGRKDRLQPAEEGKQRRRSEAIKGKEANVHTLTDTAWETDKGIVRSKMIIQLSFTHPHINPNLYACFYI